MGCCSRCIRACLNFLAFIAFSQTQMFLNRRLVLFFKIIPGFFCRFEFITNKPSSRYGLVCVYLNTVVKVVVLVF